MSVTIWAIKADAGEAILRDGRTWFLLSLDAGWHPIPLGRGEEVLRWARSGAPVQVGKRYDELDAAIDDVREACLALLATHLGLDPAENEPLPEPEPRLGLARAARTRFLGRALRRRASKDNRELFTEVIESDCGRLERELQRLGVPAEELVAATAANFDRLYLDGKGWANQDDLGTKLFALAYKAGKRFSPRVTRRRTARQAAGGGREQKLTHRIILRIEGLPVEVLRTLATWTDLELTHRDVQVVLGLPPAEVEQQVRAVARAVGLAPDLLRVHLFAPTFRRAALRALAPRDLR